jgi:hypothetical protein
MIAKSYGPVGESVAELQRGQARVPCPPSTAGKLPSQKHYPPAAGDGKSTIGDGRRACVELQPEAAQRRQERLRSLGRFSDPEPGVGIEQEGNGQGEAPPLPGAHDPFQQKVDEDDTPHKGQRELVGVGQGPMAGFDAPRDQTHAQSDQAKETDPSGPIADDPPPPKEVNDVSDARRQQTEISDRQSCQNHPPLRLAKARG